MRCVKCGNELNEGSQFCDYCGASQRETSPRAAGRVPENISSVLTEQEKTVRKRAAKRVAILVVAIIVAAVVALVMIMGSLNSKGGSLGDEASKQAVEAETPPESSATSDSTATSTSVSARDFVGTWKCDHFDAGGENIVIEYSFDGNGCMRHIEDTANSHFEGSSPYTLSNGRCNLNNGNWITYENDGAERIVLHIAEPNRNRSFKESYDFERVSTGTIQSNKLDSAINSGKPWYSTDGTASITFSWKGTFSFHNTKGEAYGSWWIDSYGIRCQVDGEDSGTEPYLFEFVDNSLKTLNNAGTQYVQEQPKTKATTS